MRASSQYAWRACGSQGAEKTAATGMFRRFSQARVFCAKSPTIMMGHRSYGVWISNCARESRIPNFEANCAEVIFLAPGTALVVVSVAIEFCNPLLFNARSPLSGLALFVVATENATESACFQS